MKKTRIVLYAFFLGIGFLEASAQSKLLLHLNQSLQKQYLLSDIQSLKFQDGVLKVNRIGDVQNAFAFEEITKLTFKDLTTGLWETTLSRLSIATLYPQPTLGALSISFHLAAPEKIEIEITDLTGNAVKQILYAGHTGDNEVKCNDLGTLESGTYFVRITFNQHNETHKLIKY